MIVGELNSQELQTNIEDNQQVEKQVSNKFSVNEMEEFIDTRTISKHITKQNIQTIKDTISYGSLFKLFKSNYFDIHMLVYYLEKSSSESIFDFLVNEIYDKHINCIYFYLPQLCSMIIYKNSNSLEQFLTEHCTDRLKLAIKIYWLILSFKKNCHSLESKAGKIEAAMVNNKVKKRNMLVYSTNGESEVDINDIIIQKSLCKEVRLNYFIKLCNFYEQLNSLCTNLMNFEKPLRKEILDKNIEILNSFIAKLKRKINPELKNDINSYFHYGILLPFDDSSSTYDEESNIIVRILPKYSACFSSKARVPVLFTCETIKVKEVKNWEELIEDDFNGVNYTSLNTDNGSLTQRTKEIIEFDNIEEFLKVCSNQQNETHVNISPDYKEEESKRIKNLTNSSSQIDTKDYDTYVNWEHIAEEKNIFGKPWDIVMNEIKQESKYRNFLSYSIKSFIFKANDDLKQEQMCIQLIKRCKEIFDSAGIKLNLIIYEILITSDNSGIIELIPNTCSIDQIKKSLMKGWTLKDFFLYIYADNYEKARSNFIQSLAAYSIVCYIFQIKDRHNGNILLDNKGNIIHIDFGFILGNSPGKMSFEDVPFKLTQDYIDIMGGIKSELFIEYISLIEKGLLELRFHVDNLVSIIRIMKNGCEMPCFENDYFEERLTQLKNRIINTQITDYYKYAESLVNESMNNWRTRNYDSFQKYSNNIFY